jgi:hypothetical protein
LVPIDGANLAEALALAGIGLRELGPRIKEAGRTETWQTAQAIRAGRQQRCRAGLRKLLARLCEVDEAFLAGPDFSSGVYCVTDLSGPLPQGIAAYLASDSSGAMGRALMREGLAYRRYREALLGAKRRESEANQVILRLASPGFWRACLLDETPRAAPASAAEAQTYLNDVAEATQALAKGFQFVLRPWLEGAGKLAAPQRLAKLGAMAAALEVVDAMTQQPVKRGNRRGGAP